MIDQEAELNTGLAAARFDEIPDDLEILQGQIDKLDPHAGWQMGFGSILLQVDPGHPGPADNRRKTPRDRKLQFQGGTDRKGLIGFEEQTAGADIDGEIRQFGPQLITIVN